MKKTMVKVWSWRWLTATFRMYPQHRWIGCELSTNQVGLLEVIHGLGSLTFQRMVRASDVATTVSATEEAGQPMQPATEEEWTHNVFRETHLIRAQLGSLKETLTDAAFLLTIGSFLLTMELFDLQSTFLAFLLTIGAFYLQFQLFCLQFDFLRTVGKCVY